MSLETEMSIMRTTNGPVRAGVASALFLASFLAVSAQERPDTAVEPVETPPPLALRVGMDSVTRLWIVHVDEKEAVRKTDFKQSPAPVSREGVQFKTDDERSFLTIGPAKQVLEIQINGFPEWVISVPTNNQIAIKINEVQRLIDLTTPKENSTNLTVRFPDGGQAEMWPTSFARYDVMDDTSYYFSGQGKVEATEADGVKKLLSPLGYPMMGGPLTEYTDDKGRRRWRRIIPPVAFGISGEIRRKLAIATDSGTITLEAGKSAVLEMDNGALVSFLHDPANGWLKWHVQKGYVHFHIPEIRCWRAMALTDQDGAIQWNPDAHAVDVHNSTAMETHPPNRFVIAALSHSMTGAVGPRNILQYLQLEECHKFYAGGIGDEVYLRDSKTGGITPLPDQNILVQQSPATGGVLAVVDTQITPGANGSVIVRSRGKGVAVQPGSDRTIVNENGQELTINVAPDGTVSLKAVGGDHTFGAGPLGDWTFTVKEGDTLIIQPTGRRDIFVVKAGAENSNPLQVFSPEGFRPDMASESSLTFITGDSTTTVEKGDKVLVFYDKGGGGGGEVPFGVASLSPPSMDARGTPQPFGRLVDQSDPTQLLPPTVVIPPASVVGSN